MTKFASSLLIFGLLVQPALADDYVPGAPIKFHSLGSGSSSYSSTTTSSPSDSSVSAPASSKSMDRQTPVKPKRPTYSTYKATPNKYSTAKSAPAMIPSVVTPAASTATTPPTSSTSKTSTSSLYSTQSSSSKSMDSAPTDKPAETTTEATANAQTEEQSEHRHHRKKSHIVTTSSEDSEEASAGAGVAASIFGRAARGFAKSYLPGIAKPLDAAMGGPSSVGSAASSSGGGHTKIINQTIYVTPGAEIPGGGTAPGTPSSSASVSGNVVRKSPPVVQDNTPVKDKWALVIGVSKFQDPTIPQLHYSAKDARDFANFLIREQHFAPDHVRVLCDEKATRAQIMSEIGDTFFPRVVGEDDLALLFYSSHGSPANKDVGGANFLIAYDTKKNNLYATGIEMQELTRILRDRAHAKRILIVMDACHSGGGADGAKDAEDANMNVSKVEMGHGQLLISSSSESERSWESKHCENGVFTAHLMEGLRKKGGQTKLLDVVTDVKESINQEVQADFGATQHVTCNDSKWTGSRLVLGASPAQPRALPASVKSLLPPDSRGK